ncbi:hypothetical protein ACFQX6_41485 [Streptosporangium lutulentum]
MPYRSADRRRVLAAAALGRTVQEPGPAPGEGELLQSVTGEILDISPHLIIIDTPEGREERLVIAPWATAWRGETVNPADLPRGSNVIIRALRWPGRGADLGGRHQDDRGDPVHRHRRQGPRRGAVLRAASGTAHDRHPLPRLGAATGPASAVRTRLSVRRHRDPRGRRDPGTPAGDLAAALPVDGRAAAPLGYSGVQSRISGTATWSDSFDFDERGAAYPMLERSDTACDETGVSCAGLPYLALGSMLNVRNVCAGRTSVLPIVACGCMAGRFCDRCLECGTSPRGRIVELSPTSSWNSAVT